MKQSLIILEGVDKTGKSTIYQALRRATGYQPLVIDRFIGSNIVYDKVYNREHTSDDAYGIPELMKTEDRLAYLFDLKLVLLTASYTDLLKRIQEDEVGVDQEIALKNFVKAEGYFLEYFENSKIADKIMVNTSELTVEECVSKIRGYCHI